MEVSSFDESEADEPVEGVHVALLAGGESVNVQPFVVEPGATVPRHSHEAEQAGVVAQGELTFVVDGDAVVVGPDDTYAIPGGEPHAAENRGAVPVRGYEVFSPPRTAPPWAE